MGDNIKIDLTPYRKMKNIAKQMGRVSLCWFGFWIWIIAAEEISVDAIVNGLGVREESTCNKE